MEEVTYNNLPAAVKMVNDKLTRIEILLNQQAENPNFVLSNKHYNLVEAAEYCRMPVPTFRAHLAKRYVSGSKPGKSWIFSQEDLDNFLQKFRCKTADEIKQEVNMNLNKKKYGGK